MSGPYTETTPGYQYGQVRQRNWNSAGALTGDSTSKVDMAWTDTATKGVNPGWRQDIVLNRDATTSLVGSRVNPVVYTAGVLEVSRPSVGLTRGKREGMLLSKHRDVPDPPDSLTTTASDNQAKSRFLNDLIAAQSRIRGMVTLGEIGQTLRMLRNPALLLRRGLGDYFQSVNQRTRRAPRRSWGNIAGGTWLEYSFGWNQLYRDFKDAHSALEQISEADYIRIPLRAYGVEETYTGAAFTSFTSGLYGLVGRQYASDRVETIYRGATRAVPVSPQYMPARTLGFTFQDFVPTVWELIPYSFLVDYFTNVGNVIEGWSWQRSGLAWSNRTYRKSRILKLVANINSDYYNSNPSFVIDAFQPSVSIIERTSVNRSSYSGSFTPELTFELPTGRTIRKLLNVSGLLALRRL